MPFYKYDDFKQACISSALVPRGITGSVCRKSPANTMVTPAILLLLRLMSFNVISRASNAALWDIVHSSQTISLQSFRIFAFPEFLEMLHVGVSVLARFKGNLKAE
ncbi:hypothetical protein AVEN_134566-1 [Araneus ventricosus]|uniref:Uncharacterized protein n=1 Tax=Araneus ventricosus TaxID=182803 RepID=A0A4Y2UH83_ARAVE|nr:hypothetical protein AVEN_39565-1 [Araneus ventricosus]GBO12475.1 hypothetical protein AVEN_134566-1 [Araneus ventricosus]